MVPLAVELQEYLPLQNESGEDGLVPSEDNDDPPPLKLLLLVLTVELLVTVRVSAMLLEWL